MEGLIYIAFCLLVAWFADTRNRNPFLCFLWAVVFTPLLVFIVYAIMGRKDRCAMCHGLIYPEPPGWCAHCGRCHANPYRPE